MSKFASNSRKTHCKHGHPFTDENTSIRRHTDGHTERVCLVCDRARSHKKRAPKPAPHNPDAPFRSEWLNVEFAASRERQRAKAAK